MLKELNTVDDDADWERHPVLNRAGEHRYPGIDLAEGLELFDGDVDLYMAICARLVQEASAQCEAICLALQRGDREALLKHMHRLKGSAANVGARQLAALAGRKEEELIRSPSGVLDQSCMRDFFKSLNKTVTSLRQMTADYARNNPSGDRVSPDPDNDVKYIQPELEFARPDEAERSSVLIVDDSCTILRLVSRALQDDYTVKSASNASQALVMARSEPVPAIILLDVVMPELSGYDLCRILKTDRQTRNIPVVFLSAMDSPEDRDYGFKLGAADFIAKPLHMVSLKEKIRQHIDLRPAG